MKEKSNIPSEYTFGIKLLIVLYALTPFVPRFETIDPIGSQWLYIGIVNIFSIFIVYKLNGTGAFRQSLFHNRFIYLYFAFVAVAGISLFSALNLYEGFKVLSRIITSFIALVFLYPLFRVSPKNLFDFLAKTLIVFAFLIAFQVVFHFIENWNTPRLRSLLKGTELLFGSRNVTSAGLAILLPFCLWGIVKLNNKWRAGALISLFFSVSAIFYIGSRTALLSASLVLTSFIVASLFLNFYSDDSLLRRFKSIHLPLLFIISLSFVLVTNSNRIIRGKSNSPLQIMHTVNDFSQLRSVDKLVEKTTKANTRKIYYLIALDDIKANLFSGVGIGSWKLANKDKYFAASRADKYIYPSRTHNDFLQLASETGILGGLIYLGMFGLMFYILIKNIAKSQDKDQRLICVILLLALSAYSLDAFLNFPLERAPIQAFWVLIIVAVLALLNDSKNEEKEVYKQKSNILKITLFAALNVGALLILYSTYKIFVAESYIRADTSNKDLLKSTYTYRYDQARGKLSSIFNVTADGKPVDHYLAMYALSEGNNDLALSHLDKAINIAPNHYESKGLKAIIYGQRKKNLDSAIYYANEGFQKYPSIKNNYVILLNAYREQNDTVAYFNTYDAWLEKFPDDVSQWQAKAERLFEFYKDEERVIKTIDKAISLNPGSQDLAKFREKYVSKSRSEDIRKWYRNAFAFIKENNNVKAKEEFLKILEVSPTNGATLLNLGIIELKMKQYQEAIGHLTTIIDAKSFKDGRPEYNRARAHEELGEMEKAKKDYSRSKKLGYKLAQKLPKNKLE